MTRRPRPTLVTTTLPALATLLGACQSSAPRFAPNPPAPHNDPPPPPPPIHDAGVAVVLEPTLIDPNNIPNIPLAGAPMPVSAMPPPTVVPTGLPPQSPAPPPAPSPAPSPSAAAPSPSAAAPMAPAPIAPEPTAPTPSAAAPAGVYLVHNHPPGTPCRPVSRTELLQVMQRNGR